MSDAIEPCRDQGGPFDCWPFDGDQYEYRRPGQDGKLASRVMYDMHPLDSKTTDGMGCN